MAKTDCMRCGTGLCPRTETWAKNDEPCGPCDAYLPKRSSYLRSLPDPKRRAPDDE